ncbi:MAG TPA: UDP-N-acetylmuramoyl-L-alanine--D-glutamate ligase [Polyangiaceae bacterium]|nr:UDP-N-acetylmuramoyl-L-alanine--D-glutamate ligase [Polyangiaceae bacterium]
MLQGRKVIVVGLGKSGVSAAKLCLAFGAQVVGTDAAPRENLSQAARELGIELFTSGHEAVDFESFDLIVVSPGVPMLPALERAQRAGVEIVGELELAARYLTAPLLLVGGTNGKSTTTTLLGDLIRTSGKRVFVGGNLGTPACEAVSGAYDYVVFEVSSFQLEHAPQIKPRVNILLNVTEDHLDRYPSFQAYADAKGNSFVNQSAEDVAIIPSGDAQCEQQARRGGGRIVYFGGADYVVSASSILERATGERFDLSDSRLFGTHNHLNAAAAVAAARAVSCASSAVRQALQAFEPLAHRMARVARHHDVNYYDDSKGTNVGASVTALLGLSEERAVLIAGGRDKHGSYEPLVEALLRKGRAVVLIGEASARIAEAIAGRVPTVQAESMIEAVRKARELARPGDAVLLSPACSSFDMFKSYADRGDQFARAVQTMITQNGGAP